MNPDPSVDNLRESIRLLELMTANFNCHENLNHQKSTNPFEFEKEKMIDTSKDRMIAVCVRQSISFSFFFFFFVENNLTLLL